MRSEIGKIDLDKTFEERESLNVNIVTAINLASEPWGVQVMRYEIKDIEPPRTILDAMERQMKAEREKRATILESEGNRQSAINVAEGAKQAQVLVAEADKAEQILRAEGEAQAIIAVADAQAKALETYQRELEAHNLVDFDDLIGRTIHALESDAGLRAYYQHQYGWVSIDEYQDVDEQQVRLIKLLVPPDGNICAIGDPDQAIYRFRGADVRYFTQFTEDFPNAQVLLPV